MFYYPTWRGMSYCELLYGTYELSWMSFSDKGCSPWSWINDFLLHWLTDWLNFYYTRIGVKAQMPVEQTEKSWAGVWSLCCPTAIVLHACRHTKYQSFKKIYIYNFGGFQHTHYIISKTNKKKVNKFSKLMKITFSVLQKA